MDEVDGGRIGRTVEYFDEVAVPEFDRCMVVVTETMGVTRNEVVTLVHHCGVLILADATIELRLGHGVPGAGVHVAIIA